MAVVCSCTMGEQLVLRARPCRHRRTRRHHRRAALSTPLSVEFPAAAPRGLPRSAAPCGPQLIPGRYCSPRCGIPLNSRHKRGLETIVDDMAGNIDHMVAGKIWQATPAAAAWPAPRADAAGPHARPSEPPQHEPAIG